MSERDNLIEDAQEALTNVFNDMSVDQSQTADDLNGLKSFIDDMLNTLN